MWLLPIFWIATPAAEFEWPLPAGYTYWLKDNWKMLHPLCLQISIDHNLTKLSRTRILANKAVRLLSLCLFSYLLPFILSLLLEGLLNQKNQTWRTLHHESILRIQNCWQPNNRHEAKKKDSDPPFPAVHQINVLHISFSLLSTLKTKDHWNDEWQICSGFFQRH